MSGFIKHDAGKPQLDLIYRKAFDLVTYRRRPTKKREIKFHDDVIHVVVRYKFTLSEILEGMAAVLQYGAEKYNRNNWKRNTWDGRHRIIAAQRRHLLGAVMETYDFETGIHHAFHALANSMFLLYLRDERKKALRDS